MESCPPAREDPCINNGKPRRVLSITESESPSRAFPTIGRLKFIHTIDLINIRLPKRKKSNAGIARSDCKRLRTSRTSPRCPESNTEREEANQTGLRNNSSESVSTLSRTSIGSSDCAAPHAKTAKPWQASDCDESVESRCGKLKTNIDRPK